MVCEWGMYGACVEKLIDFVNELRDTFSCERGQVEKMLLVSNWDDRYHHITVIHCICH